MKTKPSKKKTVAAPGRVTKTVITTVAKRKGPPPPPPPPPPPLQRPGKQPEFAAVLAAERKHLGKSIHPEPPDDCSHLEFVYEGGGTHIVAPAKTWMDYAKVPGVMRYGQLVDEVGYQRGKQGSFRYHPAFDPTPKEAAIAHKGPPPPPGTAPAKPKTPRAPGSGKREGVCAFIDATIMEGGRTAEEILELVMAKFPGRDPKATLSTIRCRPSHIRKAGNNPPAFASK